MKGKDNILRVGFVSMPSDEIAHTLLARKLHPDVAPLRICINELRERFYSPIEMRLANQMTNDAIVELERARK